MIPYHFEALSPRGIGQSGDADPKGGTSRKDGIVQAGQEVLVVDRSGETTAVLRAVFEPRGVRVTSCPPRRMARLDQASSSAVPHPVMVVDVDETPDDVLEKMTTGQRPLVLIGRIETSDGEPADPPDGAAHLLKPFHYADLIRTVEAAIRTRTA